MKILIEVWFAMTLSSFLVYGDTGVIVSTMVCGAAIPHVLTAKSK